MKWTAVTEWGLCNSQIESGQHGVIYYDDWCEYEVERLKKAGIRSRIEYKKNPQGEACRVVRKAINGKQAKA